MHKSRLGGIIIDCQSDDLKQAGEFWSQALGYPLAPPNDPAEQNYMALETGVNELQVELQKVNHPSRVHIDIETDDISAEVARLEKIGAKRIKQVRDWWVMQAPTGHRFCVVSQQRSEFDREATIWE